MSHWRKNNPPAAQFNVHLTRWSIMFTVVAGVLIMLSLHGHA
jgi:hypothetical protein